MQRLLLQRRPDQHPVGLSERTKLVFVHQQLSAEYASVHRHHCADRHHLRRRLYLVRLRKGLYTINPTLLYQHPANHANVTD